MANMDNNLRVDTLCWDCARAGGKCPWSENLVPVDGWDATPETLMAEKIPMQSFIVKTCPLFKADTANDFDADVKAVRNLAISVVEEAVYEFQKTLFKAEKYRANGDNEKLQLCIFRLDALRAFFRSEWCDFLLADTKYSGTWIWEILARDRELILRRYKTLHKNKKGRQAKNVERE